MYKEDILFLANGNFYQLINTFEENYINKVNSYIDNLDKEATELSGTILEIVSYAFGFTDIINILKVGNKFYKSICNTCSFENFINILETIFYTKNVRLINNKGMIDIQILEKKGSIISYYTDNNQKIYISKEHSYSGIKNDILGNIIGNTMEIFINKFLEKFVATSIRINSVHYVSQFTE